MTPINHQSHKKTSALIFHARREYFDTEREYFQWGLNENIKSRRTSLSISLDERHDIESKLCASNGVSLLRCIRTGYSVAMPLKQITDRTMVGSLCKLRSDCFVVLDVFEECVDELLSRALFWKLTSI